MPSLSPLISQAPTSYESSGGRLIGVDGRVLPLKGASLTADAKGGLIRVTLEQTFANAFNEPLRVTYTLPLPADGAVSGFSFSIGDTQIIGEVDTKKQARQRFEDAIIEGRTAAILDQERTSVFTQEVGNIPPRTEVVCRVTIDQKLAWLPDGFWEWRFPTVVAPRYLGETGRVADHAKITVDVADQALPVKLSLAMSIRDQLPEGVRPESPSHALHTARGVQRLDVTFGDERGVGLDRDVVVRWKATTLKVGTSLDTVRLHSERAFGLVTLVPPALEASMKAVARDLIVLLDTSGSMSGMPLDQARRVTSALIDTLSDADQLELIEFSNTPRRWKSGAVSATASNRRDAQAWLARLRASGGTEMRSGILEALRGIRNQAQRQVVLITDGLIGSEHEVLQAIAHQLPAASRVHTIGVGSGVNRSLTQPAARAGRGVEFIVGLGEDAEVGVKRLLARTSQPLVTELSMTGSAVLAHSPQRLPDLYGGAPALLSVKLDPRGGSLLIRGKTAFGELEERITVPPMEVGEGSPAIATLFGRELVEDLEQNRVIEGNGPGFDERIETAGLEFQISTRLTSWVAVSSMQTVDPRAPRRTENQPQSPVYGLSAEGLGLRAPTSVAVSGGQRGRMVPVGSAAKSSLATPEAMPVVAELDDLSLSAVREMREEGAADFDAEIATGASLPAAPPLPLADGPMKPRRMPEATRKDDAPAEQKRAISLGGLGDAVKRAFGLSAGSKGGAVRRLLGALVRLAARRLVASVVVDAAGLKWAPTRQARVELADGRLIDATVDFSLTTQAGTFAAGVTVTLVLDLSEDVSVVTVIHLVDADGAIEISL